MSNGLWLIIIFVIFCCYGASLIICDKEFKDD